MATSNQFSVYEKDLQARFYFECKAYFCINVFRSYREELLNKMDGLVEDRNDLQDNINQATESNDFHCPFLSQIDEWHKFTVEKVKQVAENAYQQVIQLLGIKWLKIFTEFKIFSEELIYLNETKDFFEHVLTWLKQVIRQFHQDHKQLNQSFLIKFPLIRAHNRLICVEEKSASIEITSVDNEL